MSSVLAIGANLVALAHIAYFLFVLVGTVLIGVGLHKRWEWIRNRWFRLAHAAAIFVVVFEEATGIPCVLNLLQWRLRSASSGETEATSGVGGALDALLYRAISPVVLDVFWWSAGLVVLLLLWKAPVHWRGTKSG